MKASDGWTTLGAAATKATERGMDGEFEYWPFPVRKPEADRGESVTVEVTGTLPVAVGGLPTVGERL